MTLATRDTLDRRPIASRELAVFQRLASRLARSGISPNAISASSIVFGAGAGAALAATSFTAGGWSRALWLGAAALVQLRLIANLLDGMVAVEARKRSPLGELFNEAPDRISDASILVGAGYAAGSDPVLGYLAALLAVLVAYLRALGATAGAGQVFAGPMAKPQRMFVVTLTALWSGLAPAAWQPALDGRSLMTLALVVIGAGSAVTLFRRWRRIVSSLRSREA